MTTWVYIKSEPNLWAVGFYDPNGAWHIDSRHTSAVSAITKTAFLNGANFSSNHSVAVQDVLAERRRQIEVEGRTPETDDRYCAADLALAGACYALSAGGKDAAAESFWPWSDRWWRPTNPRRDLVKAGALILAEIERLDREEERKGWEEP